MHRRKSSSSTAGGRARSASPSAANGDSADVVLFWLMLGSSYRDRASRQEGLDNKIWTMVSPHFATLSPCPYTHQSLAQQKEKLLERSVALLQKFNMSPFFVSVINVGVTSFEHVSQGAASIQQYLSAPSAKKKHIDDTTYVCTRCDVTLPAFCKDAHELFHQEDHSHINPI